MTKEGTYNFQQKLKKYMPILVLGVGVIAILIASWGLFSKVANVSQVQHSSFIYHPDGNVNLSLKQDGKSEFWLYVLDVARYHKNKKTVVLQSPYKKIS